MELLAQTVSIFTSLDQHLEELIFAFGPWVYILLFLTVFAETGLIITPFLPGDSLLFAAGALAARSLLSLPWLFFLLFTAAVIGDAVNYWAGRLLGPRVFYKEDAIFLRREYLDRTRDFFSKHGSKSVVLARFFPILRTIAPFLAGIGHMNYARFTFYNIAGALIWISIFLFGGYLFGNLPFVADNFSLVIIVIVILSLFPVFFEYLRRRATPPSDS